MGLSTFIALALASSLGQAAPADPPSGAPAPTAQLTRAPTLLDFVDAPYPPEAKALKLTGEVLLDIDLDETGKVTQVQLVQGAGHGFDEAALEAAKRFHFTPAEIDGKPSPVRIGYRYAFVLTPEAPPAEEREQKAEVNFRGVALERGTRKKLVAAQVALDAEQHAETDAEGRFSFAGVQPGKHKVVVLLPEYLRYETEEEIRPGQVTEVTYYVRRRSYSAFETVVRGQHERKEVARVDLRQEEIRLIPGTQGDALKVVQNLPGVARSPYGFGLLVVRGSRPNDTHVYLDGVQIPLLFHFGGLTSVFNSDLLSDIAFYPGNFGVEHGRATGGVVAPATRPASPEGLHGYANVNLIDSTLLVEGPLSDTVSVAASGRRSYVDLVLKAALPSDAGLSFMTAPRYYDYQLKVDVGKAEARDRLTLMSFGSSDQVAFLLSNAAAFDPESRGDFALSTAFHRLSATQTHLFNPRLRNVALLSGGWDRYQSSLGKDIKGDTQMFIAQVRDSLVYEPSDKLTLTLGTDNLFGRYQYDLASPPFPRLDQIPDPMLSRQVIHDEDKGAFGGYALFGEAIYKPWTPVKVVPGVRVDYIQHLKDFSADPRVALFGQLREGSTLKGAVGLFHQPPDYRAGQLTKRFGNPELHHETALHGMVGVEQRLSDVISLDLQLYYKALRDLAQPTDRMVMRDGQLVPLHFENGGEGRSYGMELLLRHELTRNFFGWVSYSLSRSDIRQSLTGNEWKPGFLDQPHNLVVVASYKLPADWIVGARVRYTSGIPRTPLTRGVYDSDADRYFPIPENLQGARLPDFFQVDLRVDKRLVSDKWMLSAYLDVQNVTNRANAEAMTYNYDYTQSAILQGLPIFPSLGIKGEF